MPKSFKICAVRHFNDSSISLEGFSLKPQYNLTSVPETPQTTICKSRDPIDFEDFRTYTIEHEHEVSMYGRVNQVRFARFIRRGIISAYQSSARSLMLLSGKKDDILDFCKTTASLGEIKLAVLQIDMKALLAKLAEVKLVWFNFPGGMIRASALMGDHLETTADFERARSQGEISTLSFYVESKEDIHHPVMVTSDGTVVLQDLYRSIADEVELVLNVKKELLDGTYREEEIGPRTRRRHPH
ncbi:MAG TPA: hypothetical protein VGS15_05500 [Candidatus Acidoferrales bacterium]|nr:hypothetical protein [Candidatus Acidoferrales bacterium]